MAHTYRCMQGYDHSLALTCCVCSLTCFACHAPVKSGARDLLTNAVAELLAVRPRMPLSFLAAQLSDQCCVSQGCLSLPSPPNASYSFQASTHPIASNAQMLRASYASKSRFQDSMVKVFQAIGSSSPVVASKPAGDVGLSSSVLPTKTIASAIPGSTTTPFATRSGKAVGSGEHCQQPGKHQPVLRTGTTTLDRRDFVDLLECLCEDFPNGLQQRTLDAVRSPIQTPAASVIPQQQPPQLPEIVSFAEFQRGVEVCLLLEGRCSRVLEGIETCGCICAPR